VVESELGQTTLKAKDKTRRSPVLGFLGDVCREGRDFLSRSSVLSLLMAIGLPGLVLVFLFLIIARQPDEPRDHTAANAAVARITGLHQAAWHEGEAALSVGAILDSGRRLRLQAGLAEILFADGAKVVVEGPATFRTDSSGRGFLEAGRLVAYVPKGAAGFTVETPAATIVDLGTEFGVSVESGKKTAEVEVFRGKVDLKTSGKAGKQSFVSRLIEAGQAVRVVRVGSTNRFDVQKIAPSASLFVRRLPAPLARPTVAEKPVKRKPAIVAEFSGGDGKSQVDQFPGRAGPGWNGPWQVLKDRRFEVTASIRDTKPLRRGGDYLQFLAVRALSAAPASCGIARRFKTANHIDLRKPYAVSFDLRVDELGRFYEPSDNITIAGDSRDNRLTSKTTGWAIRVSGSDDPKEKIPPRHWRFLHGDGKGSYRQVDSGIKMEKGRIYSFRVVVDPGKKTWTPSIGVDGAKLKTFKPMGIRSAGKAEKSKFWPYLCFHCQTQGANWRTEGGAAPGEDRERIGLSIDSIVIDQTEKPKPAKTRL
jgi:hypothetical protein